MASIVLQRGHAAATVQPEAKATTKLMHTPTPQQSVKQEDKHSAITPAVKPANSKLPQTDDQPATGWSLVGFILGMLGLGAWRRNRKHE